MNMKHKQLTSARAALSCLVFAGCAFAHHAVQAQFDLDKPVTVTGIVTRMEWINPHSYLSLDAKGKDGKLHHWEFEMAGPGALRKAGLSRSDRGGIKSGDTVIVDAVLAKDGTDLGLIKDIKMSDGRVFTIWSSDPNAK